MYTSDLTEAQKAFIKETIPMDNWTSKHDFFLVFDAVLYVDKTGCQWRNLPHDFPAWQTVYYYFRAWSAIGEFKELLDSLVAQVRFQEGQAPEPSVAVVDAQSVRAASYPSPKGFDGNKKVKGIKRQIAVDKNGHLLDVKTTTANIHDSKGGLMLLALLAASHPAIKKILADRGYRGDLIELVRNAFGMNVEITLSGSSDGKFIPAKGRWVAERSISWLDNFRRLCRNYEDTLEVARQMVIIAGMAMLLNRLPAH